MASSSVLPSCSPFSTNSRVFPLDFRISNTGRRPLPSELGIRRCEMSARMFKLKSMSSCSRRSSGKKLMMRSIAWFELLACSVASTKCPVSAN